MNSLKTHQKQAAYRRIKIQSDYSGFDFFLIKKPMQCALRIPETILLDKNGSPRDWIFNSSKVPHHPILKKRKENLQPITIIRHLCSKFVPYNSIAHLKTIPDLKQTVKSILLNKKDAEYASKRKNIEIKTNQNDILQINILQFLDYLGENKFAEQSFYEKWRMIQERVSNSKLEETYLVQSVRRNHIIESKSCKYISVGTGKKQTVNFDNNDAFADVSPSKQLQVTETKLVEGYKFFDSYLNKKFYSYVEILIECIQKNYKCKVQSLKTLFVIDVNRQPHLSNIDEIYVRPTNKLYEMREFGQYVIAGQIKFENYVKCLQQFVIENPARQEFNLDLPIHEQHKCKGEFCDAIIQGYGEPKLKLPNINFNSRKINFSLIESVSKRKGRVIEKLKLNGILSSDYEYDRCQSSQYEDSDGQPQANVKVCQACFNFYFTVMKFFDFDAFGNLMEKKPLSVRSRTPIDSINRKTQRTVQGGEENYSPVEKRINQIKSLKNIKTDNNVIEGENLQKISYLKRSSSQNTKLRPINESPQKDRKKQISQPKVETGISKKQQITHHKQKQIISNKLIVAKLKNVGTLQSSNKLTSLKNQNIIKKGTKLTSFNQAVQQLIEKFKNLPCQCEEQFIFSSKRYFRDNLPQFVDRQNISNEYLEHLYQFMSNSPISIAPGNRIKKRPEMSLKRLSELTSYPEIVSRSTFIFDTIICDQKTTIPFCVISSKMVHNNNINSKPYQNIILVNDIFDSFIQHISMAKEILQEVQNTRFIFFNYSGQSHTIFDKEMLFRPKQFSAILDKLIYKLCSPNQMNIVGPDDTFKIIGLGFGGYLAQYFLSSCPILFPLFKGVMLVNSTPYCTPKYKEVFKSLLSLYSVEDPVTQQNAFLFYNKAINSTKNQKQDLQDKSGLNSIKSQGRSFLLKNALAFWDYAAIENFSNYEGQVVMLYSRNNILLNKQDMQKLLYLPTLQQTVNKNRQLFEIDGGHDILAQNYDDLIKYISEFIGQ